MRVSSSCLPLVLCMSFFFNATPTPKIYTLSLHDALPICDGSAQAARGAITQQARAFDNRSRARQRGGIDRKSTRLNSSHANISYAVFCLKKKKKHEQKLHQAKQAKRRESH